MATQIITTGTFSSVLNDMSGKLIIVDFWAEWCGPCRMVAPVLEAVSTKFADKLSVYKLDTDANPATAQDYQITSIPCNILFKNGKEIHRIIGFKNQAAFETEISPYL
jgi:thioredoxin 1